ncbi:DUF4435 domain-containing protein [Cystobacter fuscus]|uniref:DUF4435 domain-containing protein n=1 Tax=Cystobacter fuscus TaxID=43 RepID=UPI0009DDA321|nr:DUF4435 domain-containing protein [Cystobacter fuscus]
MSRADELRFARSSYAVAWRNFLKGVSSDPEALFCFFEGEDLKYYAVRIELVARPSKYRQLIVGGRAGVIQILNLVLSVDGGRYANSHLVFFVDKDFVAPSLVNDLIYVTPCYSIENLYATRTALERILASEFGLSHGEPSFESALRFFQLSLENFNAATRVLNGWLRQQRIKEDEAERIKETIASLNLRDVRVWEFVEQQLPKFMPKYSIASLDKRFGRTSSPSDVSEMDSWIADEANVPGVVHRGKFQMEFLHVVLTFLIDDANSKSPGVFLTTRRVALTVQKGNILSQLAQYADTPACLVNFLERVHRKMMSGTKAEP